MTVTKDDLLKFGGDYVADLMRKKGSIGLMVFGHRADDTIIAVPLQAIWNSNDMAKNIAVAMLKDRLKKEDAVCYLAVCEAWMIDHRAMKEPMPPVVDVADALRKLGRPSQHPDRIEVVLLIAGDKLGTGSRIFRIVRTRNGKFDRLEPVEMPEGSGLSDGRLTDLLVERTVQ